MKEAKKAETTEKDKTIIVLDKGISIGDDPTPDFACCAYVFFPLRW